MLIRLTEVYGNGVIASNPTYTLREVFVNPEHVVFIRHMDSESTVRLTEALRESSPRVKNLSLISVNRGSVGEDIIVAGSVEEINRKLNENSAMDLRGRQLVEIASSTRVYQKEY